MMRRQVGYGRVNREAKLGTNDSLDPPDLDAAEQSLAQKVSSGKLEEAAQLYCDALSYPVLAWQHADYHRGLRVSGLFDDVPGVITSGIYRQSSTYEHGLYLMSLGRPAEAVVRFESVLDQTDEYGQSVFMEDSVVLQSMADALITMGRLPEAEQMATQVIHEFPDPTFIHYSGPTTRANWDPFSRRALARFYMGCTPASMEDFSKALHTFPEDRIAFQQLLLGVCLVRLGRLTAAQDVLERSRTVTGGWQTWPLFRAQRQHLEAEIFMALQRETEAYDIAGELTRWAGEVGLVRLEIVGLLVQARCLLRSGQAKNAVALLAPVVPRLIENKLRLLHIDALVLLSHACLQQSDIQAAIANSVAAEKMAKSWRCRYAWGVGDACHALALAYEADHNLQGADRAIRSALTTRRRIEDPRIRGSEQVCDRIHKVFLKSLGL